MSQQKLAAAGPSRIDELGSIRIEVCIDGRRKLWHGYIVLTDSCFGRYDASMVAIAERLTLACFSGDHGSFNRRLAEAAIVVLDAKGSDRDQLVARNCLYKVRDDSKVNTVPQLAFSHE